MQNKRNDRNYRDRGRSSTALSAILIFLICLTIGAVLFLGGIFAYRIVVSPPAPSTEVTSSSDVIDTDPSTATPDTKPADTDEITSDTPVSDAHVTAPTIQTDPPATDKPVTDPPATAPVTDPPVVSDPVFTVFLPESADGGDAYLDKIVFMGDSTTYGLHVYSDLQPSQIWTPLSGTMDLFDMTNKSIALPSDEHRSEWKEVKISEALTTVKPEILVVTLGVNYSTDFSNWTDAKKEEYFKLQIENIIKLVKDNSPQTKLIFQSIYPVIDSALISSGSGIRQSRIETRNNWLFEVCEKYNVPVLKTEDVLKDANGQLKSEYNTYHLDGIHLNPVAFDAVLKYVKTHTVK